MVTYRQYWTYDLWLKADGLRRGLQTDRIYKPVAKNSAVGGDIELKLDRFALVGTEVNRLLNPSSAALRQT